jgi:hypothetical protein
MESEPPSGVVPEAVSHTCLGVEGWMGTSPQGYLPHWVGTFKSFPFIQLSFSS